MQTRNVRRGLRAQRRAGLGLLSLATLVSLSLVMLSTDFQPGEE